MQALVDFIEFNEGVDFAAIILYLFTCIGAFFLILAVLTARDAFNRYDSAYWAAVWFVTVLLLNIVGVILYLLARPDDAYESVQAHQQGGVNIPVANFTGDAGEVLVSFQLKINSTELSEHIRDMTIDIDWDSADEHKEITPESLEKETKEVETKLLNLGKLYELLKSGNGKSGNGKSGNGKGGSGKVNSKADQESATNNKEKSKKTEHRADKNTEKSSGINPGKKPELKSNKNTSNDSKKEAQIGIKGEEKSKQEKKEKGSQS